MKRRGGGQTVRKLQEFLSRKELRGFSVCLGASGVRIGLRLAITREV